MNYCRQLKRNIHKKPHKGATFDLLYFAFWIPPLELHKKITNSTSVITARIKPRRNRLDEGKLILSYKRNHLPYMRFDSLFNSLTAGLLNSVPNHCSTRQDFLGPLKSCSCRNTRARLTDERISQLYAHKSVISTKICSKSYNLPQIHGVQRLF